ncbi:MAG: hypothetical protein ACE15C_13480 [Phycisphaerae bacterium]
MKQARLIVGGAAAILSAAIALGADGPIKVTSKTLSEHQTVAKLTGVEFQKCMGRTAECPDNCGHSGDFATFEIVAYLSYKKLGQYGDEKTKTFSFQIDDNKKNLKVDKAIAEAARGLKSGDLVLLSWRHDYVTKTWPGGGQGSGPERPVVKIEKVTKEQADKLIAEAAAAASRPTTTSNPSSAPARATFTIKCRKGDDQAEVSLASNKATFTITSPGGISGAAISRDQGEWPREVVVRLKLASLESLEVSCGQAKAMVQVSSHGDGSVMQRPTQDGKEVPARKGDPLWIDVKILDADGKAVKAPRAGGYFEIAVPAGLLSAKVLKLSWIDAYR